MEQSVPETSAYKIQRPGNHPKESIQHSGHGKSLKARTNSFSETDEESTTLISLVYYSRVHKTVNLPEVTLMFFIQLCLVGLFTD